MSAVREVLAKFGIEVETEELKKGGEHVEGFIKQLKEMGEALLVVLAVEKIKEFVGGMTEQALALKKQSEMLGVSTKALQEWHFAAGMVDVSAGAMDSALMRLEKASAGGGKGGGKILSDMKIDAKDATGQIKPVTALMDEIADKIADMKTPAERTKAAMGLFGKSGAQLIPIMKEGSKGIKKYRDELAELGGGISEEFIENSEKMNKANKRLAMIMTSTKVALVGQILPAIVKFLENGKKTRLMFLDMAKDSGTLQAAAAALAVVGIMKISSALGPLNLKLALTLLKVGLLAAAFLLLDEVIHFFNGDETFIGDWIEKTYGPGSADKVRAWFTNYDRLSKESTSSTGSFGTQILATGVIVGATLMSATKDFESFKRVADGVWRGIVLGSSIAAEIVRSSWASVGAAISDALTAPVREKKNEEIEAHAKEVEATLRKNQANDGAGPLTPEQAAARSARNEAEIKTITGNIRAGKEKSQTEINDTYSAQQKAKFVDEYDRLTVQLDPKHDQKRDKAALIAEDQKARLPFTQAVGNAEHYAPGDQFIGPLPAPAPINVTVTNHITLPEGTPAEHGKEIAEGSAKSHEAAMREAAAANPGGPRR
jgi:hypothetical protein